MQHEVVYDTGLHPTLNGTVIADYRDRGYYILGGYRTPWLGAMPYTSLLGYNFASQPFNAPALGWNVGLNVRPEPNVVIKVEGDFARLGSESSTQIYRGTLREFLSQLAVAF